MAPPCRLIFSLSFRADMLFGANRILPAFSLSRDHGKESTFLPRADRKQERYPQLPVVKEKLPGVNQKTARSPKESHGGCQVNGPKVAKFLDR
jgi:hypothetical protein